MTPRISAIKSAAYLLRASGITDVAAILDNIAEHETLHAVARWNLAADAAIKDVIPPDDAVTGVETPQ